MNSHAHMKYATERFFIQQLQDDLLAECFYSIFSTNRLYRATDAYINIFV